MYKYIIESFTQPICSKTLIHFWDEKKWIIIQKQGIIQEEILCVAKLYSELYVLNYYFQFVFF